MRDGSHKHRHRHRHRPSAEPTRRIALVGNPNVGKSVFFAYLTGIYTEVSNYPGTTIEVFTGRYGQNEVIDTPGTYGISSFNDEERVARDIILTADVVVNVVDAVHLERDLFLTLHLADIGVPMVIALNLMDEAKSEGLIIDHDLLSDLTGVPVIPTVATRSIGLDDVKYAIEKARPGHADPEIAARINETLRMVGTPREALLVLEGDHAIAEQHGIRPGEHREEFYLRRRERVNDVVNHVVSEAGATRRLVTRIGAATLNPWTGIPILAGVLYMMYMLVGVFIAQTVVDFTEKTIMRGHWEPAVRSLALRWMHEDSAIVKILVGEFGILTMTGTYLIGLLLPLVVGFYFALALLEDSGYLPRLAALTDRLLNGVGLNGRAIIPIILGFGCISMATITTRLLGTQREKTIATTILNFTIPCSAQLGVIMLLLSRIGGQYALAYVLIIGSVLITIGTILHRMLPGQSTPLLIDLPPIRLPRPMNVIRKTGNRAAFFVREAFPWFLVGSAAVALMQITSLLEKWQRLIEPLVVNWVQLPAEAASAFIMGMVRRDFGAAGLAAMSMTPEQTLAALVAMTLFVPCIASTVILIKERSLREGMLIWGGSWVAAFLVGGIVSQLIIR